jgi:hypothetical protein
MLCPTVQKERFPGREYLIILGWNETQTDLAIVMVQSPHLGGSTVQEMHSGTQFDHVMRYPASEAEI